MQLRQISQPIQELALARKKMAFISGPRQAGKTTLAKSLLNSEGHYFNWDELKFKSKWTRSRDEVAQKVLESPAPRVVFDELHFNRKWKNQLKGFFDVYGESIEIIVTGSAKLNLYRKGSDSLMGRFLHFHLLPFTLGEMIGSRSIDFVDLCRGLDEVSWASTKKNDFVQSLFEYGGFPEPLFAQDYRVYNIWSQARTELLIRQDLKNMSGLIATDQIEILASLLPDRVGSPLSVQRLREDLEVAHTTTSRWLNALSDVYYHFEIKPYSTNVARSLKKEGKYYLYDWRSIESQGPRFENMVACHLKKLCHFYSDTGQAQLDLFYLRNKEKQEVDFIVTHKKRPLFTVEAKLSQLNLDPTYKTFQKTLRVPHFQITLKSGVLRLNKTDRAYMVSFDRFFANLP